MDITTLETLEYLFHQLHILLRSSMMYDDLHPSAQVTNVPNLNSPPVPRNDPLTNGCPSVVTLGPCKLCTETTLTSAGKYWSKASFSGFFTLVCPATTAPYLVDGPYSRTTALVWAASTLYIMKSHTRETAWPSRRGVIPVSKQHNQSTLCLAVIRMENIPLNCLTKSSYLSGLSHT